MNKSKLAILMALVTAVTLSGCTSGRSESETSSTESSTTTSEAATLATAISQAEQYGVYSDKDLQASTVAEATTTIQLTGDSATVEGSGVTVKGSSVTITQGGIYAVSGELAEGQLLVAAKESEDVRIVLNNATINNSHNAPVYVETADKVIVTLAKGTTNVLTDSRPLKGEGDESEDDAALFSQADLTLNGQGSLAVSSSYYDGIRSKDDLVLVSGVYQVTAANNGLKGTDSVSILDGTYSVTAENDGLQASEASDAEKGWIAIDGGKLTLTTGHDGVQAETNLKIATVDLTIEAGGGASGDSDTDSLKGLKAGSNVQINGGIFAIDAADDSLHANGDITLDGGEFELKTGDDGIHADQKLTVNNGTITVADSYEGIEAAEIILEDGTIAVTSGDDGLNAGGGNDGTETQGGFGKDNFSSSGDYSITINGGIIFIDAEGDGIDSNGDVTMTGGTALVSGSTSGGNGAMDYDGTYAISGGILIAAGSSGMAMLPSDSSSQPSLGISFDASQGADQLINIADETGTNIVSFAPTKAYQHVAISAPGLTQGSEYSVSVGGKMTTASQFGFAAQSDYQGEPLFSVTLAAVTTSVSQTGEAVTGNQMGGGNRGAGRSQPPK